jgi:hypothetical protein
MKSQRVSESRVKYDPLGDKALSNLYDAFTNRDDASFEQMCVDTIQAGSGTQEKKDKMIKALRDTPNKPMKLKIAQDFILAGMGLGV